MSDLTDLQQRIVDQHRQDDTQTDEEIAVKLDCSASYVNQVRNEHGAASGGGNLLWLLLLAGAVLLVLAGAGVI